MKNLSYINFYHNPNILANKLASETSDKFLLDLKAQLRSAKKKSPNFNEDEYLVQLKGELGTVKSKIRDILNITNYTNLTKKNSFNPLSYSTFNPVLKNTFMLSGDCPTKIQPSVTNVKVSTGKELFTVEILTK